MKKIILTVLIFLSFLSTDAYSQTRRITAKQVVCDSVCVGGTWIKASNFSGSIDSSGVLNLRFDSINVGGMWIDSTDISRKFRPYSVYTALLTQSISGDSVLTSGQLIVGKRYMILSGDSLRVGDTLDNCGFVEVGTPFTATDSLPTSWISGTVITYGFDPVATVLENDIGEIVWSRQSTGVYRATLANAFIENKTCYFFCFTSKSGGDGLFVYSFERSSSFITLKTAQYYEDSENVNDGYLNNTPIEIRVYNEPEP